MIIAKLRLIEVALANGRHLGDALKQAEISAASYHRWRKEYGGMQVDQAKRLKDLERENSRLRKVVADLSLDKAMLQEVASGNW
jgi:methylphosphotriester-DNA--protein-cysteine methyltransferase